MSSRLPAQEPAHTEGRIKFYQQAAGKLREALDDLGARGCACLISLGDVINGNPDAMRDAGELDLIATIWRQVPAGVATPSTPAAQTS